jgi:polysaccharide export outer membrane protein
MVASVFAPYKARPILLLALLLCGAAYPYAVVAQQVTAPGVNRVQPAPQPGDKVRLRVYRESELSGEFTVPEDGVVTFPKVGRVKVDVLATDSLTALLVSELSKSLRDPAIEVTVLRRVNVIGAVHTPGFYYADPTVTVKGAIALAGGVTPEGNRNRVELIRGSMHKSFSLTGEPTLADSPIQSGDQVTAPERSWFSRNTALVVSGITGIALLVVTVVRN